MEDLLDLSCGFVNNLTLYALYRALPRLRLAQRLRALQKICNARRRYL